MGYEILEHTADVGVRAMGRSLEELFEQATLGLLDITGAFRPGSGEVARINVAEGDLGALLVSWLEEVLYLQDARDVVIRAIDVEAVSDGSARGAVAISPREGTLEGTAVKAITYHQLRVERIEAEWVAVVYFDI